MRDQWSAYLLDIEARIMPTVSNSDLFLKSMIPPCERQSDGFDFDWTVTLTADYARSALCSSMGLGKGKENGELSMELLVFGSALEEC